MKEFDIEKLQRQNVFKEPDATFEEMQDKVIQNIMPAVKRKSISATRWYSAAAVIALIVGFSVFINHNETDNPEIFAESALMTDEPATYTMSVDKPDNMNRNYQNSAEENLTITKPAHQTVVNAVQSPASRTPVQTKTAQVNATNQNSDVPVDQIIAGFTSAELADVGRNTEQDIYLDLYN